MSAKRPWPPARVSFLACRADACEHDLLTQRRVAARLAELFGSAWEPALAADAPASAAGYLVPNDTLPSLDVARRWALHDPSDLFGGVVPQPVVATKAIVHPLVSRGADAAPGWSARFAERVDGAVLPGFTAFSAGDARAAARALLRRGAVRLKPAAASGGGGQTVATSAAAFDAALAQLPAASIAQHGVVIERHFEQVRTRSIGLLQLGPLRAAYFGTQQETPDRDGRAVYGGSTLHVVRGGLDALDAAAAGNPDVQQAIALARVFHDAAIDCFPGLLVSRCNYDVLHGTDAHGQHCAGVLEQSWRIGGASPAEVEALHLLLAEPARRAVDVSVVERHGREFAPPPDARVFYRGEDPRAGWLTKFVLLHPDAHARAAA